jgi:type IV pilus assembly protein PilW
MPARNLVRRNNGFSLIEILVGLAIGLIGMIVMMQVFGVSEANKRTTTGGDDAQTAGAITLYTLQRDIRQAGFGITNIKLMGCNVQLRAGVTLNALAPVTINHASIPAGDATTDTLLMVAGSSNGAQEGDAITTQPIANYPKNYTIQTPSAFTVGDQVIAQPATANIPTICNLTMEPVAAIDSANSIINVATGVAATANGFIYNLGQAPRILAYAIRNNVLTVCDFFANDCTLTTNVNNPAIWVPIANNIVSLRAQYGRDTNAAPMNAVVDTYDQSTPTTHCGWARTFAIRLALVARNSSFDKADAITTTDPAWAGSANAPISISSDTNWQHYRYKVFQTTVPIRNIVSTGIVPSPSGTGASPC